MRSLITKLLREGLSIGSSGEISGESDINKNMLELSKKIDTILDKSWFGERIGNFELEHGADDYEWVHDSGKYRISAEIFPKYRPIMHIDLYEMDMKSDFPREWNLVKREEIPFSLNSLEADPRDVFQFYFIHLRKFIENFE
jgi:hypothetical protein